MRRYWTDAERNEVKKMWNEGYLIRDIAAALNRPIYSVEHEIKNLRSVGFLRRRALPVRGWTKTQIATLKRRYNEGAKFKDIANELGRPICSIWKMCSKFYDSGDLIRRGAQFTREVDAQIIDLARKGLTNRQIGQKVGLSAKSVESHFKTLRKRGALHFVGGGSIVADGQVNFDFLMRAVCVRFGVTPELLYGKRRAIEAIVPRQILCALVRRHTKLSFTQISWKLRRDHTTILHAARVGERLHGAAIADIERAMLISVDVPSRRANSGHSGAMMSLEAAE